MKAPVTGFLAPGVGRAVEDAGRFTATGATRGASPAATTGTTNLEGLAHYGLLPDMLAGLGNLGLGWDSTLLPLLTSA